MNMEIGTEATQLPRKEYINGIFVAVWRYSCALITLFFRASGEEATDLGSGLGSKESSIDMLPIDLLASTF
jgi:hypothetical protein